MCTEAGMFAIRARRKSVSEKDFLDSINKVSSLLLLVTVLKSSHYVLLGYQGISKVFIHSEVHGVQLSHYIEIGVRIVPFVSRCLILD